MRIKLKGGSLSATFLCGDYIRKEVNTTTNREYGFMRWYSQLKKTQRMNERFPGLCPEVLRVGYDDSIAYFDIEYLGGFRDIKTILCDNPDDELLFKINSAIWKAFEGPHSVNTPSPVGSFSLYFKEEVNQKLVDAFSFSEFKSFHDSIHGINSFLPLIERDLRQVRIKYETWTHGNPTLENLMYSEELDAVKFIDLYEESIVDCHALDFAQLLQCSRSFYGYINDRTVRADGNQVYFDDAPPPDSFGKLNNLIEQSIAERTNNRHLIDLLEATQFIRMLPFKCAAGDIDKAKYFYVHACGLLKQIYE